MKNLRLLLWSAMVVGWCYQPVDAAEPTSKPTKLPQLSEAVLFNTPQADAVMSSLQLFPATSAWHEDISKLPVLANSQRMIDRIGADKKLAWNSDMAFVMVPAGQKKVPVKLVSYPDESDPGPYQQVSTACTRHRPGAENLRHVDGRQRRRLAYLGGAGQPDPRS